MLPRLHTGDLVLVEHQSGYHVGEVVAYRVPKGQVGAGHVVIHRIVGGNGRTGWKMKGDNRTAPDLWYPTNHDVIGAKQLRIPDAWFVLRDLPHAGPARRSSPALPSSSGSRSRAMGNRRR